MTPTPASVSNVACAVVTYLAMLATYLLKTHLVLCISATFLATRYLFDAAATTDTTPSSSDLDLPTKELFVRLHLKPIRSADDICIICRDEPDTAVKAEPCGHVFRREHILDWFSRGKQSLPTMYEGTLQRRHDSDSLRQACEVTVALLHLDVALTAGVIIWISLPHRA